jgi:hypothetical protein
LIGLLVCTFAATSHAQSFKVEWSGDRLSVAASKAALPAVLAEVSRQTRVSFVGLDRIDGTLDADVKSALILDALEALLGGVNYVISQPGSTSQPDALLVVWLQPRKDGGNAAGPRVEKAEDAATAAPSGSQKIESDVNTLFEKIRIGDLGPWLEAVKSQDPSLRAQALQKLAAQDQFESLAAQVLDSALEDPDPTVRDQAFEVLAGRVAEEELFRRVEGLLAHPDAAVRLTAVSALKSRTGEEVTRLLNRAAGDDNAAVRNTAVELLRDADLR